MFSDQVMDLLQGGVQKGVCADLDTIRHLFSTTPETIPEPLKRFVVDRCVDAGMGSVRSMNTSELPPGFIYLMLSTALRRLATKGSAPKETECVYHTHATAEACYKRQVLPADQTRAQRYALEREKSSKDLH